MKVTFVVLCALAALAYTQAYPAEESDVAPPAESFDSSLNDNSENLVRDKRQFGYGGYGGGFGGGRGFGGGYGRGFGGGYGGGFGRGYGGGFGGFGGGRGYGGYGYGR